MNLEDQMNVARDADRMSTRDIKNAKARAKRAAAKAAAVMNTELPEPAPVAAVPVVGQPTIRPEVDESASAAAAPVAKETPEPVKITVKKAVLDWFYAVPGTVFSTQEAVAAIRAVHPGMNESSIRVWITDFQKDGSIKKAGNDGRKVLLTSGKLGKFSKGYVAG